MTKMRYEFRDLLTQEKIDVLPLYGVNMTWNLMTKDNTNYGTFTGTFRSDLPGRDLSSLLSASEPARTALWCYRNEQPIWGGIIWNRTYSSQAGGTYQLYAQSFDSYLARLLYTFDITWTDDARNIIRSVWGLPVFVGSDLGCHVPPAITTGLTNVTKTVLNAEQIIADDVVKEMVALGAEYRMRYWLDSVTEEPQFGFELGRWDGLAAGVGIAPGPASPEITYPGLITNYWFSDSGTKGGTHFWSIGKGTGATTPRSFYIASERLAAGYPTLFQKLNFRDAETQALNDSLTIKEGQQGVLPYSTPSIKFAPISTSNPVSREDSERLSFGSFDIGDHVYTIINDKRRFVDPFKAHFRVTSISLSPETSDGFEDFEFSIGQMSGVP